MWINVMWNLGSWMKSSTIPFQFPLWFLGIPSFSLQSSKMEKPYEIHMGLISHFPAHCAIVYLRGFALHCVTTHSFWSHEAEVILQTAIVFKGLDGGGDDAKQDREAHTKKQTSWKFPGDQSCDMVTPSQTLFQNSGYDGCLLTICLRKKVKSRVLLTCVFTLGCWDICWEQRYPKTVLEESFTNLLGPQQGLLVSAYFFHVVWRDNLYAIALGCVSHSKKPFSRKPDLFGCPGEWQAGPTTAVSTHLWRGRLFQLSLLCFMSRGREGCGCSSRGGMQIRGILWMKW